MPREWPESALIKEWTEFPDDGYDYSQHMLTDEKAEEILALGGGNQRIFVMAPSDLTQLEKDPLFTGELETDPARLQAEERNLCLDLKDNISMSSDSVSDVEELLDYLLSVKDVEPPPAEDAEDIFSNSSLAGECSVGDVNVCSDILTEALETHLDSDLKEALRQMDEDEDDFDEAQELEPANLTEDINCLNQCVDLYNEAMRSVPAKPVKFGAAENRKFIELAVARQLEEESDTVSDADSNGEGELEDDSSTSEVFHFDQTLLVNMASSETAKQRQRPIVNVTRAKQVDIADLMF